MRDRLILSKAGLLRLQEKAAGVEEELRRVLLEKGTAAETGGNVWHDNFSFEELCRQEAMLSKRLGELRQQLSDAEVVDAAPAGAVVRFGATVVLRWPDGSERTYSITDPILAEPAKGLISYQSPIARAIAGAREGESREYDAPSGRTRVVILKIS